MISQWWSFALVTIGVTGLVLVYARPKSVVGPYVGIAVQNPVDRLRSRNPPVVVPAVGVRLRRRQHLRPAETLELQQRLKLPLFATEGYRIP